MKKNKAVITGIGVISPNGIGKDEFWKALKNGTSGIKPISVFDSSLFKAHLAAEVINFDPAAYLGDKGLRNLDRGTKFLCSAAKLAIDDASLQITEDNTNDIGVVTATTLSVIWNISAFSKEAEDEGPQFVNPAMFPGTTINAPSSQVSIKFNIKGFNTTISTGFTAGLDSLRYALDFIKLGRAKAILVAGVESLFFQTFVGFHKLEFLAGIKGEEVSAPFDLRRNGIIIGEGSAVLVLENEDHALKRNAKIYAEVGAVENFFDPFRSGRYNPKAEGLRRSISHSLKESKTKENDIDYICSSANSVQVQDMLETKAIKDVFENRARDIPTSSIKSMIGEAISASGILQVAASIGAMENNFIPPTINYQKPDPACDLDYCPNKSRDKKINKTLITNFGPGGNNAACVLIKYE
ncbi:MAG: beta-ketoacyl-[acyl-carrier-protein] synthase family protein [Candidatus Omnitrophota bacterium]|nr:beta-ketoacyl-[acyl-carrier-protein] synthase family protein [Candidatus Omnitrophota bacterium]MBU1929229.1 beta-ketoacyl-[acyl-carrier-protein] synthase family protein [Candidatus Omnitrophota bacterium]MBU2034522.1 beta-ketoacyl-[acyl-carrier-protein] synthase family protein [Candidatus Omnitrophota bacterium]MBU2222242.1 beta-ketoacyl-[acyl-carrier-protein] synthase family protein [Candidatus Omnitrophota bacterium]